jgi:hypothetical protein
MGFLSDLVGGITGSTQAKAASKAGRLQQEAAQRAIDEQIVPAGEQAISRFDPLAGVGQRGIDLAGILGDPQAQAELAFNNPLFDLSRQALTEDINRSAASRGRLTAGDTLESLQQAGAVAAQPFIDRQKQDVLNLLNLGQGVAGQQSQIDLGTAQQVTDLLTGGAAAKAAGTVGAANARSGLLGNVLNLGATPATAFAPQGSIFGAIKGLF